MAIFLRVTNAAVRASASNIVVPGLTPYVVNGDFLVLELGSNSATGFNTPTGWTLAKAQSGTLESGVQFYRTANNEPDTYNVTLGSGTANIVAEVRGYASDVPGGSVNFNDAQAQANASSATDVAPSVALDHLGDMVLWFGIWQGQADPVTAPTGFTNPSGTGGNSLTYFTCNKLYPTSTGTTGAISAVANAAFANIGMMLSMYETVPTQGFAVSFPATASFTVSTNQSFDNTTVTARASFTVVATVSAYLAGPGRYRY